jgi:hypothetical protein
MYIYSCDTLLKAVADRTKAQNHFDLLDMLVDPVDPVQTVENFFDFSFLVRTKNAIMEHNKSSRKVGF